MLAAQIETHVLICSSYWRHIGTISYIQAER